MSARSYCKDQNMEAIRETKRCDIEVEDLDIIQSQNDYLKCMFNQHWKLSRTYSSIYLNLTQKLRPIDFWKWLHNFLAGMILDLHSRFFFPTFSCHYYLASFIIISLWSFNYKQGSRQDFPKVKKQRKIWLHFILWALITAAFLIRKFVFSVCVCVGRYRDW